MGVRSKNGKRTKKVANLSGPKRNARGGKRWGEKKKSREFYRAKERNVAEELKR